MAENDREEAEEREAAESRVRRFVSAYDRWDFLLALVAAGAVWTLLTTLTYPILHPQIWGTVTTVTGIRPPASAGSGLWTFLAHRTFVWLGFQGGLAALTQAGHVGGALLAGFSYLFMRRLFSARFSLEVAELDALTPALRLLTAVAAFLLGCSEAFWRMAQFLSAEMLCLLLAASAILSFERFRRYRGRGWYCLCHFLSGILVAETPFGILLVLVFFGWNWWERKLYWASAMAMQVLVAGKPGADDASARQRKGESVVVFNEKKADDPLGFFEEELSEEVKRSAVRLENGLFFLFFSLGLVLTLVIGFRTFRILGGLEVAGLDPWGYPVAFFLAWFKNLLCLARPDHLFFLSLLLLFPCVIAFLMLPIATDPKHPFAIPSVLLVSILGCVAWSQLGPVSRFWYWTWNLTPSAVPADVIRAILAFFGAAALMAAWQVLCCVCRKRIDGVRAISVAESRAFFWMRLGGRLLLTLAVVLSVALSACGRRQGSVCRKMDLIGAYVRTFARQVADLDGVFTDGVFDDALALEFRAKGKPCPHLLSMTSGRGAYPAFLRLRAAKDAEDARVLKVGALETLRFWAAERKERLARLAIQVGYEVLAKCHVRNGRSAGLALRVGTAADTEVFDGFDAAAEALGDRALALATEPAEALGGLDAAVSEKFDFILWRLARMTDLRVAQCLLREDGAGVVRQRRLAERLDGVNDPYRKLKKELEKLRPVESVVLSPQEGLALALKRADFNLAYRYATRVLKEDPDDLNANFAMGMWAAETRQYKIALLYLETADSKRPNEPSILNNLAMVRYKLGDLRGAVLAIKQARDLNPASKEIQENVKRITEAVRTRRRAAE